MLGRKVVAGMVQPKRTASKRARAELSRIFIWQFEDALAETRRELEDLWASGALSVQAADLIAQLFQLATATLDRTLRHTGVGAPRTSSNARTLLKEMQSVRVAVKPMLKADLPRADELVSCFQEFCCDIEHYQRQIRITHSIVHRSDGGEARPANRPTNWPAKAEFAKIVSHHQEVHGTGTFPKPSLVIKQLRHAGHIVPARTLGSWRSQIQSGTFRHHIQPQKRQ
ncbi:MAG: hypothetical protein RLZZ153_408 [Pseudomonadota bacterium]